MFLFCPTILSSKCRENKFISYFIYIKFSYDIICFGILREFPKKTFQVYLEDIFVLNLWNHLSTKFQPN